MDALHEGFVVPLSGVFDPWCGAFIGTSKPLCGARGQGLYGGGHTPSKHDVNFTATYLASVGSVCNSQQRNRESRVYRIHRNSYSLEFPKAL